jgi:DNA adenine methylase
MRFYRAVQRGPRVVCSQIQELALVYNTLDKEAQEALFYDWRKTLNRQLVSDTVHAGLYWMFNRTCYNGMPRYAQKGGLNTPWGKRRHVNAELALGGLMQLGAHLDKQEIVAIDAMGFEQLLRMFPLEGAIVFFDPPYHKAWSQYTPAGFDWLDQVRLSLMVEEVLERGGLPYVCNADTPEIRGLYKGTLDPIGVEAPRPVNCDGKGRGEVPELLFIPRAA